MQRQPMQQQRKRNCALRDHWTSRKSRGRSSCAPVGRMRGWRKARRFAGPVELAWCWRRMRPAAMR
uniref:Uncharacterized protein n=1 Tax=Arundo donax TaxID=35708 RepID=A0A0A9FUT4_ARUDO